MVETAKLFSVEAAAKSPKAQAATLQWLPVPPGLLSRRVANRLP